MLNFIKQKMVEAAYYYNFRRYSIFVGNHAILDYLDFIENWYRDHCEEISAKEMEGFTNKLDGIRREWPAKVCSQKFKLCYVIIAILSSLKKIVFSLAGQPFACHWNETG